MNGVNAEPGHDADELRDDVGANRFELVRDGRTVAWMKYKHLNPNRYVLLHTEVDQAQRGHGIGRIVVEAVLDEVRSRQGTVTAICPYVAEYLAGTEQYKDLVDPSHPGYPNRAAAERGDGTISE
ncbi:GNAT family N-acetyltransferase [Promicromonospora sp. NPDC050262]|uniref:GNAT family N-acetyltransferase n=1 Tax=Promicromonospora sp. NPDC050262 TaxID=3155036 RepID=UPI0033EC165C